MHACCRRDGGVCEDEELIPSAHSSLPPIGGARFGIWDFAVHPGEIVDGNELIPSRNSTSPYVCQPMFAKWSYVNLLNGQIGSSEELELEPEFVFAGPAEGHYLSVEVSGESETWNEWAWDFCELGPFL